MAEFLLTFIFLLFILAIMAIGVMRGRAPIAGSCGGLQQVGSCEICGSDTSKCEASQYPAADDDPSIVDRGSGRSNAACGGQS